MMWLGWLSLQSYFSLAQQNILPLVILALAVDCAIVAVWYMVGAILANRRVQATARGELLQVIGTAIITLLILTVLIAFGDIMQGVFNGGIFSQSFISQYCSDLMSSSSSFPSFIPVSAFLGPDLPPGICNLAAQPLGSGDGTISMDYPLVSTGVIMAGELDQAAVQENNLFIEDAYLLFLVNLEPTVGLCIELPPNVPTCYPPAPGAGYPFIYLEFQFNPLAGLKMIDDSIAIVSTLLFTTMISFTSQIIFISMFLYLWPIMLFIGIALRGTYFTRKAGGLLIAVVLGGMLFYPAVFAMEYTASSSSPPAPGDMLLSFCNNTNYQYEVNFFSIPDVSGIASDCNCWPRLGLMGSEFTNFMVMGFAPLGVWASTIGIFVGSVLYNFAKDVVTGNTGALLSGSEVSGPLSSANLLSPNQFANALGAFGWPTCHIGNEDSGAEGMLFGLEQAYGLTGVAGYFLPIINILITLSAIRGVSGILGGDVRLAGLSRFI